MYITRQASLPWLSLLLLHVVRLDDYSGLDAFRNVKIIPNCVR